MEHLIIIVIILKGQCVVRRVLCCWSHVLDTWGWRDAGSPVALRITLPARIVRLGRIDHCVVQLGRVLGTFWRRSRTMSGAVVRYGRAYSHVGRADTMLAPSQV